jgi:hypothetical protein
MVIKLSLAGIEGFELMVEHLSIATFGEHLFKLLQLDFVLR